MVALTLDEAYSRNNADKLRSTYSIYQTVRVDVKNGADRVAKHMYLRRFVCRIGLR